VKKSPGRSCTSCGAANLLDWVRFRTPLLRNR
jgi:hypothetical protein